MGFVREMRMMTQQPFRLHVFRVLTDFSGLCAHPLSSEGKQDIFLASFLSQTFWLHFFDSPTSHSLFFCVTNVPVLSAIWLLVVIGGALRSWVVSTMRRPTTGWWCRPIMLILRHCGVCHRPMTNLSTSRHLPVYFLGYPTSIRMISREHSPLIGLVHFYLTSLVEIFIRLYSVDYDALVSSGLVKWLKKWLTKHHLITPI